MARPLRIQFPGAFYHVMSRSNEKQAIYRNSRDRSKFLDCLETATLRCHAVIHCYCLLKNHYHLLIETPVGNLAQIMHHINGTYTAGFNKRHCRTGQLFPGRYRAILVAADACCLTVSRYIHRNPVNENFSCRPINYEWSSYSFYLQKNPAPHWLRTDFLLALIGNGDTACKSYREFVEKADPFYDDSYAKYIASLDIFGSRKHMIETREKNLAK